MARAKKIKEKADKKKNKTKQEITIDLYESIRAVIKNKKPLTQNQVKQFLSAVITGEVTDSLTKRPAMMNDKITASRLLLEEYRKDEIAKKEQKEFENKINLNSNSTELTKELLYEINNRKVEGLNDDDLENQDDNVEVN